MTAPARSTTDSTAPRQLRHGPPRALVPDVAPLALDDAAADLLFREAHTAYRFTDEPVTDAQMRAVHELVKWAPTAMNGQPMRVTLVRSRRGARAAHRAAGARATGRSRSRPRWWRS